MMYKKISINVSLSYIKRINRNIAPMCGKNNDAWCTIYVNNLFFQKYFYKKLKLNYVLIY